MKHNAVYIASYSTPLLEKFINYVMLDGKKSVARDITKEMLATMKEKTKQDPLKVFEQAVSNVKPAMEVRAKRIGGAVYQIPMEVKPKRQVMLAFRWIIDAARKRKGAPMAEKLATELLQAFNNEGASMKKKEDTHRMAQANKAFAHYARY
ncbi:30S ribosomal protein S7 [Candidatus Peregrinibacteria bacterium CG11_big_fil_rev_8_21_14_0_20_41_10]|nr:MAG: 30S ribosomal protein S7 [Candidatus Peregrinibacteria bacterium CG11_big_fil_rev_8_21_14_0_20_41_10]PIZ76755.1 MAG: 30S ribosomal protein S7 [Candidatus Peregrinibacteria bacterium CG_4_10_14_0_2_um_filter_41_8]PJC38333.1 MAG: 30S ribosomal protein S7 [Candidatus Peregrinibacteria bacterium CG_4_9_14_0_2_um_filter_41_14]